MNPPAPSLSIPAAPTAPEGFIDIRGPIPPDFWVQHWVAIVWIAVLIIIIAALLFWFIRRRLAARQKPLTPAELAFKEIDTALELFAGDDALYSAILSHAVRRYIEQALQMPAPERTTEEFLQEAQFSPHLRGEPLGLLKDFLEGCDLVKFARQPLDESGRSHFAGQARAFIKGAERTRQPPAQETP